MKLLRPFAALALGLVLSPWALATPPTPAAVPPPPDAATATSPTAAVPSPSDAAVAPTPPLALSPASEPQDTNETKDPWGTLRLWGLFILALLGTGIGILNYAQARAKKAREEDLERRQTALEIDRELDQAWDLLGGRPGTDLIFSLTTDRANLEMARRYIRAAIRKDPRNCRAQRVDSLYWAAKKNPTRRLESARRAVEFDPTVAAAHRTLGRALHDAAELKAAIASFRRAIELEPTYAAVHANLAQTLHAQGELEAAIEALRTASALDSSFTPMHDNLGAGLLLQLEQEEAEAGFRRALKLDPQNPTAHADLGDALGKQKKWEAAEASYRRAVELDPESPVLHTSLGLALAEQEKLEDAETSFRRALELAPTAPPDSSGKVSFSRMMKLAPEAAIAQWNLNITLRQLAKKRRRPERLPVAPLGD